MTSLIFDLDLTLLDSSIAERARKERNWQEVYSLIPRFRLYEGLQPVFQIIRDKNIRTCIVSTAPRPYLERVVRHFSIPCDAIVGYHDAKPIKPHPAPIIKALQLLGTSANNTFSFGDRAIDIQASNAAGVPSVACLWGTKERDLILMSRPSCRISFPSEIINFIF